MSRTKTKTNKHKNNQPVQKSNIHVGYRIGALVLVIITAVSLILMYTL